MKIGLGWGVAAATLAASGCVATLGDCMDDPAQCEGVEVFHTVSVIVTAEGLPLAGADVAAAGRMAVTLADGRASLGELPEGRLRISVSASGYEPRELDVQLTSALTVSLEMRPIGDPEPEPEPEPGTDDAQIVSVVFPASLDCGASTEGRVTVRNTGSTTWRTDDGYALGAVDDSDPFSASTRVALPDPVAPGASVEVAVPLVAPSAAGTHVSDWQMVREGVAWFGGVAEPSVSVECDEPLPEVPYVYDVVESVRASHGHLLETNTFESCGEFVQRVLAALASDPEWGHVGKTSGEYQHTPADFEPRWVDGHLVTGFSHDVIYHRASNRQVDIIINAAANSDDRPEIWGPAHIGWDVIPPEHYRENNPWLSPVAP